MAIQEQTIRTRRRIGVDSDHAQYKWWAFSCTSLGMLIATINSGTLIIALPDLERSLHTTLLQLVWVILAYMIASTVLVLTAGRLSDLFGRKRAYVLGFAVFTLASLGAGFSADGTQLILWRILQGIGGAAGFVEAARVGARRASAAPPSSRTPPPPSPTRSRATSSAWRWARTRWSPPSAL